MLDNLINRFYVYAYLDPTKCGRYFYGDYVFNNEPFYIGKGSGARSKNINKRKCWVGNKIRKIKKEGNLPIIVKLNMSLCESEAYNLESKAIIAIGRKNLGLGPLVNLTDGGEGVRNISEETRKLMSDKKKYAYVGNGNSFFGKKHTKETRQKISQALIGNIPYNVGVPMSNEQKQKLSLCNIGKKLSEESKEKIKKAWLENGHPWKGKKHTEETKNKISENRKKQSRSNKIPEKWVVISPCNIIKKVRNLTEFCENNGLHAHIMFSVARGSRNHHKKWKCFKINPSLIGENQS